CANAVSPLTLGPVQSTMIGDGWTGQSPTWQSANVQSAPGGFAIASTLTLNTIATIYGPETVLREHVSEVYQVSGSFGYTVFFHSEPELVCVELEGSLADQKFDSSTCFLSGWKVIGAIEGSNELGTELQIFGAQVEDGKCVYGMIQVGPRTLRDVMRVSVRHTAIMSNGWYWPDQRSSQPDYLLGFSTGQDRVQRVSAWDWKRLDTGLTPACK